MRTVHCTPEEAAQLARDLNAQAAVGMHWGTILMLNAQEPPFEPPVRFRAAMAAVGYRSEDTVIMAIGETRAIPHRPMT